MLLRIDRRLIIRVTERWQQPCARDRRVRGHLKDIKGHATPV